MSSSSVPEWGLFKGKTARGEEPKETLKRVIDDILHIKVKLSAIEFVYDYVSQDSNVHVNVFYIDTELLPKKITIKNEQQFMWTTFKYMYKLKLSRQIKQDLTVSQRVIQAKIREKNPQPPLVHQSKT